MCKTSLVFLALVLMLSFPAAGTEYGQSYSFPEAGFTAPFPSRPVVVERDRPTSQSRSGSVKARTYSANQGGVVYSVEIMDFRGKGADADLVIAEAASAFKVLGRLLFDQSSYIDQVHGQHLVILGSDGTRHTEALFYLKDQLFQIRVSLPQSNRDPAGSSGIIRFLAGFQFLDPF